MQLNFPWFLSAPHRPLQQEQPFCLPVEAAFRLKHFRLSALRKGLRILPTHVPVNGASMVLQPFDSTFSFNAKVFSKSVVLCSKPCNWFHVIFLG